MSVAFARGSEMLAHIRLAVRYGMAVAGETHFVIKEVVVVFLAGIRQDLECPSLASGTWWMWLVVFQLTSVLLQKL